MSFIMHTYVHGTTRIGPRTVLSLSWGWSLTFIRGSTAHTLSKSCIYAQIVETWLEYSQGSRWLWLILHRLTHNITYFASVVWKMCTTEPPTLELIIYKQSQNDWVTWLYSVTKLGQIVTEVKNSVLTCLFEYLIPKKLQCGNSALNQSPERRVGASSPVHWPNLSALYRLTVIASSA